MRTYQHARNEASSVPAGYTDKHIVIIYSTNPGINAMTKGTRLSVLAALRGRYDNVSLFVTDTMDDLARLAAMEPDLVVMGVRTILLEPKKGKESSPRAWIAAYLHEHGINFSGSGSEALANQLDKQTAKQMVLEAGLRSPSYFISHAQNPSYTHQLNYPLFVKPTNQGGSKGIDEMSLVLSEQALKTKIDLVHSISMSDALIEEYLPGREFSVAVVRQAVTGEYIALPVEITSPPDTNGNTFLSKAVKKADLESVVKVTDEPLKKSLCELAIGVFDTLGSRDYGRVDIRLNADNEPSFIEANLMPGLSNHGYLSRCFLLNNHTSYEDMVVFIIALGLERTTDIAIHAASKVLHVHSDEISPTPLADATIAL